jgi:alcohol dehydrogenase class IV
MRFDFATATRIMFGPGVLKEVGPLAASFGKRALVVIGVSRERAAPVFDILEKHGIATTSFIVTGEPTTELARDGVEQARAINAEMIVSFGGGSALDAGKAIAALVANGGDPLDYLEVVGRGQPLTKPSLPFIALPTTAGTGAEVTSNAVLAATEHRVKVSLRSPLMLARAAVVDPELTYNLPPEITASTGLDALTQNMEPFVSNKANPLTDSLAREGMMRAARSLRRAYEHGEDAAAREDMAVTSLFGGLALANAKLGAVHGFAGPIGGMFHAPHGAVCARLLPYVMSMNVQALRQRAPESDALRRYDEVARILTGKPTAVAQDGVLWIQELCAALNVPGLGAYGISQADFPTLIEKSAVASSMQGNPIKLTSDELGEILAQAV